MVTIAIYKPVSRSLKSSLTKGTVKDHKRAMLNEILAKSKNKGLNDFLSAHFDTSYSDGFSHKNISLVLGNDCRNKRLKGYTEDIKKYYRPLLHQHKVAGMTYNVLPVDLIYETTGDFATQHFYNRPCTLFMAFNRGKAGSLIQYWIKSKYRNDILRKLDEVWEDGMIMEIVF